MTRLLVDGLGARVGVELLPGAQGDQADHQLAERFSDVWSRCLVTDAGGEAVETIRARLGSPDQIPLLADPHTPEATVAHHHLDQLMNSLTQAITYALIRARMGELLMLHAGGVSHVETGRSIALVAPGGTGKSTLTRALAQHHGYLSDETIGIEPGSRRVLPYPKPLSMRTGAATTKTELSPDALGLLQPGPEPVLTQVVLLTREPSANGVRVTQPGLVEAIETLAPQSSSLARIPRALHMLADLFAVIGVPQQWTYSEHEHLVPLVDELLGAP